ncbi:MAG: hypothetical protein ABJN14_03835 [Paracoccaceae bacterium]
MVFDAYAALAELEIEADTPATSATSATQAGPMQRADTDLCHGTGLSGNPKTWSGKIISLSDWRDLSRWEKHGPDRRHWDGETQSWKKPEEET